MAKIRQSPKSQMSKKVIFSLFFLFPCIILRVTYVPRPLIFFFLYFFLAILFFWYLLGSFLLYLSYSFSHPLSRVIFRYLFRYLSRVIFLPFFCLLLLLSFSVSLFSSSLTISPLTFSFLSFSSFSPSMYFFITPICFLHYFSICFLLSCFLLSSLIVSFPYFFFFSSSLFFSFSSSFSSFSLPHLFVSLLFFINVSCLKKYYSLIFNN